MAGLLEDGDSDALAYQGNNRTRKAEHCEEENVSPNLARSTTDLAEWDRKDGSYSTWAHGQTCRPLKR